MLVFLLLLVAFLVGGLDAVDNVRQSVSQRSHSLVETLKLRRSGSVCEANFPTLSASGVTSKTDRGGGQDVNSMEVPPVNTREQKDNDEALNETLLSQRLYLPGASRATSHLMETPNNHSPQSCIRSNKMNGGEDCEGNSNCCGFGNKVKWCMARLPLDKIKILVVVWQILTVFPSITAVEFPPGYSRFLSWVEIVNFDLGNIFSASCAVPSMHFYHSLLLTTLGPIVLVAALAITYQIAKRRTKRGPAGGNARREAWSRHNSAGLLLTFFVS